MFPAEIYVIHNTIKTRQNANKNSLPLEGGGNGETLSKPLTEGVRIYGVRVKLLQSPFGDSSLKREPNLHLRSMREGKPLPYRDIIDIIFI